MPQTCFLMLSDVFLSTAHARLHFPVQSCLALSSCITPHVCTRFFRFQGQGRNHLVLSSLEFQDVEGKSCGKGKRKLELEGLTITLSPSMVNHTSSSGRWEWIQHPAQLCARILEHLHRKLGVHSIVSPTLSSVLLV